MQTSGARVQGVVWLFVVAACGGRSLEVVDDGTAGAASRGGAPHSAGAPSSAGAPQSAGAPSSAGAPGFAGSFPVAGAPPIGPNEPAVPPGDPAPGSQIFHSPLVACNACHGERGEGLLGPNITMSLTAGIGAWSYRQFYDAVRFARDRDGQPLCILMVAADPSYVSDQGVADLYAFLSTTRSDVRNRGTYCP